MQDKDDSNHLFQLAASFVHYTDRNIFLTGRAGTGKTTFLRRIIETTQKKAIVVAPTGVAAINAGGVTIHSFFQLPLGPYIPGQLGPLNLSSQAYDKSLLFKNIRISGNKRRLIEELDLLIIDEVSMVRADLLDAIDVVLRYFRSNEDEPFGGVQLLMIGDLFQLPPVVVAGEWELLSSYYDSPFFFASQVLRESPPLCIELQKIYRQSEKKFIDLLNRVRNNEVTQDDLECLDSFVKHDFLASKEEHFITLASHNYIADRINERELNALPGKRYAFNAIIDGIFHEKSFPADEVLQIKRGAQIMFIRNDKGENRRYFNGKIGIVEKIDKDEITIRFPGEGTELQLEREEWKNVRYHYNEEKKSVEEESMGTFKQFPIRLAWAITIHKSQGLTFDKAIIDAGASFSAGQVYVALSRLTSLDGLVLRSKINKNCIRCDHDVKHFMSKLQEEDELNEILKEDQKTFIHKSLMKSFDWRQLISLLEQFIEDYQEKQSSFSGDAIIKGTVWKEKALEQKQIADRFIVELNRILAKNKAGYAKLHERVGAANIYFDKRIKEDFLDDVEKYRSSVKSKAKSKKYLKTLRALEIAMLEQKTKINNAVLLAEGLLEGLDSAGLIQKFEKANHIPVALSVPEVKKPYKGESQFMSYLMFRQGKSIETIARERRLSVGTVESHLARFIASGDLSVYELMPEEKVKAILPLVAQADEYATAPIRNQLGDDYSYSEIRAVINHHLWLKKSENPES